MELSHLRNCLSYFLLKAFAADVQKLVIRKLTLLWVASSHQPSISLTLASPSRT